MSIFNDHPALRWLDKDPFGLPVYSELFAGAQIETMGESPYLNAEMAGISFALSRKNRVQSVFLYGGDLEGFAAYTGPLPGGLSFANSRADLRGALGTPAMSGEAGGIGLMAIEHSWDRFESEGVYVRFEYHTGDSAIRLVTIGQAD